MDFADFNMVFADLDLDSADFDADSVDFNVDLVGFDAGSADFTDFGLELVKLTISFHSTVRIQGRNINFFWKSADFAKIRKICRFC